MSDSNNSQNNCPGNTVVVSSGNSSNCAGAGTNNPQWYTVTSNTIWTTGTITITGGQLTFDDIDLAVPVEEKKEKSDGCSCKKCKEYYQYAEPNQDDGTLICYGCRMVW